MDILKTPAIRAAQLRAQAAEYRALGRACVADMQATTLPGLRAKYRSAAERWLALADANDQIIARAVL